jgi:protein-tyrosine-phosphatase
MKRTVLFVCTGNVCRSPMAAALFAAEAKRRGDSGSYETRSAGTWALDDEPASPNAQAVMQDRGLTLEGHRARTVTHGMLNDADLVLVMSRHHQDSLGAEFPASRFKIHLLSELVGKRYDVDDPYGAPRDAYQACAVELFGLIEQGYRQIEDWIALAPAQDPIL